jgi:hypothetical protein
MIVVQTEATILYYFVISCQDLFTTSDYPFFSFGVYAKGYIAIGIVCRGIVSIGVISQGFFTISLFGSGLFVIVGVLGGGFGFGMYQIGVSWYCLLAQLSFSLWGTGCAQGQVDILRPLFKKRGWFPFNAAEAPA